MIIWNQSRLEGKSGWFLRVGGNTKIVTRDLQRSASCVSERVSAGDIPLSTSCGFTSHQFSPLGSPRLSESAGKRQLPPSLIMMLRVDLKGIVGVRQRESFMGESRNGHQAARLFPKWLHAGPVTLSSKTSSSIGTKCLTENPTT